jgi:putative sigma-54 modulation protein
MNIHITARHYELDPEVRAFAHERLSRLSRFVRDPDDLMEAHVIVTAEKYRHMAEITLKLRRGDTLSREEAEDAHMAIDLAADRLEQQMRKLKERRVERLKGDRTRPADRLVEPAPAADDADGDWTAGGAGED